MFDRLVSANLIACEICGEPTEQFPDNLCSSCSLERQMKIDEFTEETEHWNKLSEAEKDRAIRHASAIYIHDEIPERFTETEEEFDDDESIVDYGEF